MTFTKGHHYNKGRVFSKEHRKKISEANLRNGNKPPSQKGIKQSEETRIKKSKATKGEKSCHWIDGRTAENMLIRKSFEYKLWRTAVFERDKYTCIWCGLVGGKLEADHIQLFSTNPELRFAIDNGRTLCKSCHIKRHKNQNNAKKNK